MKLLISAITFLASVSSADSTANVGRFANMSEMVGNYSLIPSNGSTAAGICSREMRVEIASLPTKNKPRMAALKVGSLVSLALENMTSTSRNNATGCTKTEIAAYNDTHGWSDERGTVICKDRVAKRWYKKITLDYDFQTVRMLIKEQGRTTISCKWEKSS